MSRLISDPGYLSWAPRPEGLIVEEGRNRLYGLVGRRGRFLWRLYHIGCPLFSEAKDDWILDVCAGKRIMLGLGLCCG